MDILQLVLMQKQALTNKGGDRKGRGQCPGRHFYSLLYILHNLFILFEKEV